MLQFKDLRRERGRNYTGLEIGSIYKRIVQIIKSQKITTSPSPDIIISTIKIRVLEAREQ